MTAHQVTQQFYTAAELAGLPDLPATVRGVQKLAERENWGWRERQGRGGGREYHKVWLPQAAKQALLERSFQRAGIVPADERAAAPAATVAPEAGDGEVDIWAARGRICTEIQLRGCMMGIGRAEAEFLRQWREGSLAPELAALVPIANEKKRGLSGRTLRRWREKLAKEGPEGLRPKAQRGRRGDDPEWLAPFLRAYLVPTKPSVAQIYEQLQGQIRLPTLRTVQRRIDALGPVAWNRGRMGPRELKQFRAYTVRTVDELLPGDVYTADGHCADIEVQHPQHGKPFRPEIVAALDVKTRRAVGWSAGIAEGAWLVADALRRASCEAGIPAIFYTDNGPGFVNELLGAAAVGQLDRLGTMHRTSLPYNSQARGVIERFNATCLIRAAKTRPAYVGHDMDPEARQLVFRRSRQEIEATGQSRLVLPWDEFLQAVEAEIEAYNTRPHSGLPRVRDAQTGTLRHMSPDECWRAHLADGWAPLMPTKEEQVYLFRPHELRVVNRGQVRICGNSYFAPELDAGDWHGSTVQVAYDIKDPSRVWVKDEAGRLIAVAERDGNAQPYFPKSEIEKAREKRAAARLQRLERHAELARAEAGLEPPAAKVIELRPEDAQRHRELVERMTAPEPAAAPEQPPEDRWYADAKRIEAAIAAGEDVTEEDREWLQGMQQKPWYEAREAHRQRREELFQREAPDQADGLETGA